MFDRTLKGLGVARKLRVETRLFERILHRGLLLGERFERLRHVLERLLDGLLLGLGHVARLQLLRKFGQLLLRRREIALRQLLGELGHLAVALLKLLKVALERLVRAGPFALADFIELVAELAHALDRLAALLLGVDFATDLRLGVLREPEHRIADLLRQRLRALELFLHALHRLLGRLGRLERGGGGLGLLLGPLVRGDEHLREDRGGEREECVHAAHREAHGERSAHARRQRRIGGLLDGIGDGRSRVCVGRTLERERAREAFVEPEALVEAKREDGVGVAGGAAGTPHEEDGCGGGSHEDRGDRDDRQGFLQRGRGRTGGTGHELRYGHGDREQDRRGNKAPGQRVDKRGERETPAGEGEDPVDAVHAWPPGSRASDGLRFYLAQGPGP